MPLKSRNLLEDPLYQRSHGSQFVQMADLVAFTGYPSLLTTGDKTLTRRWYADHLAGKDVTAPADGVVRVPGDLAGPPGHRLLVWVNQLRIRPVLLVTGSGVTEPRFGGAFVFPGSGEPRTPLSWDGPAGDGDRCPVSWTRPGVGRFCGTIRYMRSTPPRLPSLPRMRPSGAAVAGGVGVALIVIGGTVAAWARVYATGRIIALAVSHHWPVALIAIGALIPVVAIPRPGRRGDSAERAS